MPAYMCYIFLYLICSIIFVLIVKHIENLRYTMSADATTKITNKGTGAGGANTDKETDLTQFIYVKKGNS